MGSIGIHRAVIVLSLAAACSQTPKHASFDLHSPSAADTVGSESSTSEPRTDSRRQEENPTLERVASADSPPVAPSPEGFVTREAAGSLSDPAEPVLLTTEEQERYDAVARALLEAMNAEDVKAYRALHSDEGWESAIDWWRNMFVVQRA